MKEVRYDVGKRYHNGEFVGWALWQVRVDCFAIPATLAEFFGKKARKNALQMKELIEKEGA